jgi:hypothetical protein
MQLKVGSRWKSTVCDTQVIVVRAPSADVDLGCGGQPMVPADSDVTPSGAVDPARAEGTLLGKRYVDDEGSLELLCTKAGNGSLTINGAPIGVKDAKPLPSSD